MRKRPLPTIEFIRRGQRIAPAVNRAIDAVLGKRVVKAEFPSRREVEAVFRAARKGET